MNKLKYLVPIAVLFIGPWMHLALYKNLMLANIGVDPNDGHVVVWVCQALVTFFTFMWAIAP